MARFVQLKFRVAGVGVTRFRNRCFNLFAGFSSGRPAHAADGPDPNSLPLRPRRAATNAPPALPPDTFGQYGKIVAPSDQMAHPLRLKMPFPGAGEVKIPSADELKMREKLEQLATLSDDDIRAQLEKWPAL